MTIDKMLPLDEVESALILVRGLDTLLSGLPAGPERTAMQVLCCRAQTNLEWAFHSIFEKIEAGWENDIEVAA